MESRGSRDEPWAAPVYDFATHTRRPETQAIEALDAVVVEGILALHQTELREAYRTSVFVEAPEAVRLTRRLDRDVRKRGRTVTYVHEQFERTVRPMHERYVAPTRGHAAVVADGERPFDAVVERLLGMI